MTTAVSLRPSVQRGLARANALGFRFPTSFVIGGNSYVLTEVSVREETVTYTSEDAGDAPVFGWLDATELWLL